MKRTVLAITLLLVIVSVFWLVIHASDANTSETIIPSLRSDRCFHDSELREIIATLKKQAGDDLVKVYTPLLSKARADSGCRMQVIQAVIDAMSQATNPAGNEYQNFFLWLNGAGLLADLKATEALDLLIANIDFTDGWSGVIKESHFPALVAILKIGRPAIPKLEIALSNDSDPDRRQFAAFCIAYIGGRQAKMALKSALPRETDPCLKRFLQVSLQAFNNKKKPNHISSELNGKWIAAFYCRSTNRSA